MNLQDERSYHARSGWRFQVAWRLHNLADRIDYEGAFKKSAVSYEFIEGQGIVTNTDDIGCPLWYHGDTEREAAFDRYDSRRGGSARQTDKPVI